MSLSAVRFRVHGPVRSRSRVGVSGCVLASPYVHVRAPVQVRVQVRVRDCVPVRGRVTVSVSLAVSLHGRYRVPLYKWRWP